MAPTVCLVEFPPMGSTVNEYIRRRPRSRNGASNNRRSTSIERTLRTRTIGEASVTSRDDFPRKSGYTNTPKYSLLDKNRKILTNMKNKEYKKPDVTRRRDLLNIIIRTIILVRRDQILQRHMDALTAEIQKSLRSNNPQDQCRQQYSLMSQLENEILPLDRAFTALARSYSPDPDLDPELDFDLDFDLDPNPIESSHHVTSTHDIHDYDNEEHLPDDKSDTDSGTDVDM